MSGVATAVAGVLVIAGALYFLVTAVGMLRSRDAISRVNNLSPATGAGLPLIILGVLVDEIGDEGFVAGDVVKALLAVGASLVVSSVASNVLGRAAYRSQEVLDPRTRSSALGPHEAPDTGDGADASGSPPADPER